jgi:hypothetical protein
MSWWSKTKQMAFGPTSYASPDREKRQAAV